MMTKNECAKIVRFREERNYTLRHGEYARPTSKVRKHPGTDSYGISTKYFYFNGTFGAKKDGFENEEELIQELNWINEVESRQNE